MFKNKFTEKYRNKYAGDKTNYKVSKAIASVETKPLNPVQRRQIKKILAKDLERKHHTKDQVWVSFDTFTPRQYLLTAIAQQTVAGNDQTRVGDQLKIKSLVIRIAFNHGINLTTSPIISTWRVIVLQDKSYNATGVLDDAQVFTNDPNAVIPSVLSARNVDHVSTKIILYDKLFTTSPYQPAKAFIIRPKLKYMKKEINYNAGSTTAQEGGLYLVMYNDTNATTDPYVTFQSRIYFTDA